MKFTIHPSSSRRSVPSKIACRNYLDATVSGRFTRPRRNRLLFRPLRHPIIPGRLPGGLGSTSPVGAALLAAHPALRRGPLASSGVVDIDESTKLSSVTCYRLLPPNRTSSDASSPLQRCCSFFSSLCTFTSPPLPRSAKNAAVSRALAHSWHWRPTLGTLRRHTGRLTSSPKMTCSGSTKGPSANAFVDLPLLLPLSSNFN